MASAATIAAQLRELLAKAGLTVEADAEYWAELGTSQDTQEAETSGLLSGQVCGLTAALILVESGDMQLAEGQLDLGLNR